MKDLKIVNGDVVIGNHDVQLVSGKELTMQKIQLILGTNQGEWLLDENEGINFRVILTKHPSEEEILSTLREGLKQVDDSFIITDYKFTTVGRKMFIELAIQGGNGDEYVVAVGQPSTQNGSTVYLIDAVTATDKLSAGNALSLLSQSVEDNELYVSER